ARPTRLPLTAPPSGAHRARGGLRRARPPGLTPRACAKPLNSGEQASPPVTGSSQQAVPGARGFRGARPPGLTPRACAKPLNTGEQRRPPVTGSYQRAVPGAQGFRGARPPGLTPRACAKPLNSGEQRRPPRRAQLRGTHRRSPGWIDVPPSALRSMICWITLRGSAVGSACAAIVHKLSPGWTTTLVRLRYTADGGEPLPAASALVAPPIQARTAISSMAAMTSADTTIRPRLVRRVRPPPPPPPPRPRPARTASPGAPRPP